MDIDVQAVGRVLRAEDQPAARIEGEADQVAAGNDLLRRPRAIDVATGRRRCSPRARRPRRDCRDRRRPAPADGRSRRGRRRRRRPSTRGRRNRAPRASARSRTGSRRDRRPDERPRRSAGMLATSVGASIRDTQNRARSIADIQRAVGTEGDAAGDAEIRGDDRRPSRQRDPVDAAVEAARDVERALAIERQRGRVGHVGDERLARAVRPHDEDRDRRLLAARAAEGDVEIARRDRTPGLSTWCRPVASGAPTST